MKPVNTPKDFLTNCYSREGIHPFIKKMEEEYLTSKKPFTVLILDIDHFKTFNDKYGHLTGDEVLKYFSSSMRLDLEDEENAPFRFGGDEFVMVFPGKTSHDAARLANRLKKNIRTRSCLIKGKQITVTFSAGLATYPTDANNIEEILDKADKALYYSKNHGRQRITKYSDLGKQEFIQMLALFAIMLLIGGLLYLFRDPLTSRFGKATAMVPQFERKSTGLAVDSKKTQTAIATPAANPDKTAAAPNIQEPNSSTTAAVTTTPAAVNSEPVPSVIHLLSGRVIKGFVVSEDAEQIKVSLGLQEGKGEFAIKKSLIAQIEPAATDTKKPS